MFIFRPGAAAASVTQPPQKAPQTRRLAQPLTVRRWERRRVEVYAPSVEFDIGVTNGKDLEWFSGTQQATAWFTRAT